MAQRLSLLSLCLFAACRGGALAPAERAPALDAGQQSPEHGTLDRTPAAPTAARTATCADCASSRFPDRLEVRFLGVAGFSLAFGGDRVLTAPLYTNPSMPDVLAGTIRSEPDIIDRFFDPTLYDAKAILVGHAHYDHLLDVPYVWSKTAGATIYGNLSVKHILSALSSTHAPSCSTSSVASDEPVIPDEAVVAIDAPGNDRVDYRLCATPQSSCPGANDGRPGEWIAVPGSHVRIHALCSSHPAQFIGVHFANGCIDSDLCQLPPHAIDWREGGTIAYLIDFLDHETGRPVFRAYFQDAPTSAPVGNVHPDLLAEKAVDVALLCVGNFDQVRDQPGEIIAAMKPRFVIGGHWESFFKIQSEPLTDIPFLPVDTFVTRMNEAMPPSASTEAIVNGHYDHRRAWLPNPGWTFSLPSK
jgi:hypothetical protein